ncbi:MAG: ABC transporter permease [Defluviitaleaceae bacterium]|nr:ABC transporter permease [Defluviitaleaceae bacterium]
MSIGAGLRKFTKSSEFYVLLAVVLLCAVIGMRNPAFLTVFTGLDLLRASIVPGIMVFAVMLGIIAGGIDVSFPAIAVSSMFLTARLFEYLEWTGPVAVPILMSVAIGTALGTVNGLIIAFFKLPAFIVTLGTSHLFHGMLVWSIGARPVNRLPPTMDAFSRAEIFRITGETHSSAVPVTFWFLLGTIVVVYFILNYTMLGRGIYAIGGDRVSAERAGFNVRGITIFVYAFIGFASGLAGIVHTIQSRASFPVELIGSELLIIAAAVLGGTHIGGGKGTVLGSILGLALITISRNSLIMMGIPATAQMFVVGLIIVAGTGMSAYQAMRRENKLPRILDTAGGGVVAGK